MRLPHRAVLALGLLFGLALAPASCEERNLLNAKVIEHRSELVGGPVAIADVGDFLLENDQIRVAILRAIDSPGPGVFGGSLVDIDLRRPRIGYQGGHGIDRFAEAFPFANLMVPEPETIEVTVLNDGSDGVEAAIRVEGDGEFFFQALGILRSKQAVLDLLFPNVRTRVRFTTDYIVRPGARHVLMRTRLALGDEPPLGCPPVSACPNPCPDGRAQEEDGCLGCGCSQVVPLDVYSEPVNVFARLLGDNPSEAGAELEPGILAGDFVFFGNQNDVFAPGPGFDEEGAVQAAFNAGLNTFQQPLTYDYVAAAGGDISYGYFTVAAPGGPPPQVNVPLFESAATTFLVAGKNCRHDDSDDVDCDPNRTFEFERYLVVGEGDIASVAEEIHRVRGTATGELRGGVFWEDTGEPVPNASLYLFADPEPGRLFATVDEVVAANLEARGDVGVVTAIDADVGLDLSEDGDFHAQVPPGNYLVVARAPDESAISAPYAVVVDPGGVTELAPVLPRPATVRYRVVDESGRALPAKLTFVALDDGGEPLFGDGRRRPYLGDSRLANGVRSIELSHSGEGEALIEPGRYDIVVSRGIEYSIQRERDVELMPGALLRVDALLRREVDTRGWLSADMHLHSTPSFDSGMPVERRVLTTVVEGVELAVSTDHDVATDYQPVVRALGLDKHMKSAVGAEITTLEQGHFIGFPLAYDHQRVPTHGAHDWTCESGAAILDGIRAGGDEITPFTIVAHPRDGFFGYLDQLGVDAYRMTRKTPLLEESNPVFRIAGCAFDAMELINGKRFDLVRTPTIGEVVDWSRCLGGIDRATTVDELGLACSELGSEIDRLCRDGERYRACQARVRTRASDAYSRRMLTRTPSEQHNEWAWPGTQAQTQELCDLRAIGDAPLAAELRDLPCNYRPGHIDDFFRLLDHGMRPTQIASSDSHGPSIEPGSPRTYFRSATDDPSAVTIPEAVDSLRAGHAFATYGPFVRAQIANRTFGELVRAAPGANVELELDVLSASWFGVDRVEIYLNGEMYRVLSPDAGVEAIVDLRGKVSFPMPARDSWVVVVAMGLKDENLLRPVALDVQFGEIPLARIVADAFSRIPVVSDLFAAPPTVPDFSPVYPYAVTNPIFLDSDGNGRYDAPLPAPEFCSRPCSPDSTDPAQCPPTQVCLEPERQCGFGIGGRCIRRPALPHGG
jgi:hypothetical protein